MKACILVCCASSVATSTLVATSLRGILEDRGMDVHVTQCGFPEMDARINSLKPALVLVTGSVRERDDVPVLVATPFLTGIGKDAMIEQVIEVLNKYQQDNP